MATKEKTMREVIEELKKEYELIKVMNYGDSPIVITIKERGGFGADKGMTVEPFDYNTGIPGFVKLTWQELQAVHETCPVFRNGMLEFEEEFREPLYYFLRISDWENLLFRHNIEDIIKNPTLEKLQRIVALTSVSQIHRFRSCMLQLMNEDERNVSSKVERVINMRFKELQNSTNRSQSSIVLTPKDAERPISQEEASSMKEQMAKMEAMIAALQAGQTPAPATAAEATRKGKTKKAPATSAGV